MRAALVLTSLIAVVLLACGVPAQARVPISATASSGVSGSALLSANGAGTTAELDLAGLRSDSTYRVQLQGGSCEQPSASFAQIAEIAADKDGRAKAAAPVRFRDEDLDFGTVTDGSRILAVLGGTGMVACGAIVAAR